MIPYRVAVITDIHIDNDEELRYNISTKSNLLKLFQDIKSSNINFIIITGDLCYNVPKIYIYKWIKEKLDEWGFEYLIIPGNHDNPQMIKEVFNMSTTFYSLKEWNRQVLFLDTYNNRLPIEQQDWIKNEIKNNTDDEIIIFMHHPPVLMGSKFMDTKYPLRNIEQTQELFLNINKKLTIFCGHYHTEIIKEYGNQQIYLTPSNIFQIDRNHLDFTIESYNPGWRYLEFSEKKIITQINYIDIGRDKK